MVPKDEVNKLLKGLLLGGLIFEKTVRGAGRNSAAIFLPAKYIGQNMRVMLIPQGFQYHNFEEELTKWFDSLEKDQLDKHILKMENTIRALRKKREVHEKIVAEHIAMEKDKPEEKRTITNKEEIKDKRGNVGTNKIDLNQREEEYEEL